MKHKKIIQTQYYDLDWNRHVTSRTYEKMAYATRMEILKSLGYPIGELLKNKWKWISQKSFVRFHLQQVEGADLVINTEVFRDTEFSFLFHHKITDLNEKLVCTIGNQSVLLDEFGKTIQFNSLEEGSTETINFTLSDRKQNYNTLEHNMYIPFSDMNCFWNLPCDSIWKIFEEGRFLFFHELVDLNMVTQFDTSTFFMGGEIEIFELPEPGSTIKIHSWIDEVQKIRFYFRQDIVSQNGKLLAKMKDEQLFVSLSNSKPKKAPSEFLKSVESYIRV